MKRIILFSALLFMAVSCMVPEGGNNELWVSGTEFVVEDCGGEVVITTSGVVQCSIAEIAGEYYEAVNLRLNADEPISHEGSWYSFRSEVSCIFSFTSERLRTNRKGRFLRTAGS